MDLVFPRGRMSFWKLMCMVITSISLIYVYLNYTDDIKLKIRYEKRMHVTARMKSIYESQAPSRRASMQKIISSKDADYLEFYNTVVPEVLCPELVRIGTTSDGGKWMCNPQDMPRGCKIVSLGLSNSITFEEHLQNITDHRCTVLGVDMTKPNADTLKRLENINIKAVETMIGEDSSKKSIDTILEQNAIRNVEILKIDIEGSEFESLLPFLNKHNVPQLLIEIHATDGAFRMAELVHECAKRGYWLFSYEINGRYHELCEFSFIHFTAFKQYSAEPLARYLDF